MRKLVRNKRLLVPTADLYRSIEELKITIRRLEASLEACLELLDQDGIEAWAEAAVKIDLSFGKYTLPSQKEKE